MHIPDGFLTESVAMAMGGVSLAVTAYSVKKSIGQVEKAKVPLMAATAALVFAGQMVNFQIAGGTSGHFLGAVFTAMLFGPYLANLLITAILVIQMVLFQDGGLLALGANACNMAVIGTFGGYWIYRTLKELLGGANGIMVGGFVAGWFAVVLAATACALQLSFSDFFPPLALLGAMAGVHIKIGVAEGILTLIFTAMVIKMAPTAGLSDQEWLLAARDEKSPPKRLWRLLLLLALLAVMVGAPFASLQPDGLERVATDYCFSHKADLDLFPAPFPEYHIPGVDQEMISTAIAGLLGVFVIFFVAVAMGMLLHEKTTILTPPKSKPKQQRIIHSVLIPYLLVFAVLVCLVVDGTTTYLKNRIESLLYSEADVALGRSLVYLQEQNKEFFTNVATMSTLPALASALRDNDGAQAGLIIRQFQNKHPKVAIQVTNAEGVPVKVASDDEGSQYSLWQDPFWREGVILAGQGKKRFGYTFVGGGLVKGSVSPVWAGGRVVGGVTAIRPWDEAECGVIQRLTGGEIFLFRGDILLASSITAKKGPTLQVSIPSPTRQQLLVSDAKLNSHFFVDEIEYAGVFRPINGDDGSTIGTLIAAKDTSALRNILHGVIKTSLLYGLAGLGVIALIALLIARGITDPLKKLATITAEVAAGNLSTHVDIDSHNEFGVLAAAFNRMIDQLDEGSRDLILSKKYTENILRSMADALIIVNMEGHILTINDAAARLLGYRQEDLVDQPLARLLASERRSDLVAEFIHNSRVGVRIIDWEVELCDATGQVIPVSVCSACLSGATVNGEAVIMSARDMRANRLVSELSTTAEQLRREIATRQQAEAELRASEEKYRTLFETAGEGIVIIDQASTLCLFVNQAMAKLFGYEMEELLAKKITDLLPEEAREEFNRFFFGKDGNRESVQLFPCLRKDNSIIHARITNTSMILGEKTCLVGFFSDVTEQKLANQALEKAKNEAEAASRAKTEFLARISHELRTPMNGIIGLTGIMLNSELAADQHHYLKLIKSSANNLLGMISDVLDFSNLETETLAVQNFDFKLRQVLAENMIRHEEKARAKGLGFAWQVENEVPDTLRGDFQRLLQIISKLVANGIMFTDDGEVTVTLSVREKSEGSVLLLCRVQDTGVGIAPDQQALIFQPFTQVDGSFTRNYGGMGLGLALTAQLVKLMDGEIWLESPGPVSADGKEGQGSTFYFTARFAFLPEKADDHGFNLPA